MHTSGEGTDSSASSQTSSSLSFTIGSFTIDSLLCCFSRSLGGCVRVSGVETLTSSTAGFFNFYRWFIFYFRLFDLTTVILFTLSACSTIGSISNSALKFGRVSISRILIESMQVLWQLCMSASVCSLCSSSAFLGLAMLDLRRDLACFFSELPDSGFIAKTGGRGRL